MLHSDDAPAPRNLTLKQLVAWVLCTIPAGTVAGGLFYVGLVAQMTAQPHRYYSYQSSTLEQLATGATYGGIWTATTSPFILFLLWLWDRLSRRLPVLESSRLSILLGMFLLALPSTYTALLAPPLAPRVTYRVDLCVWLVVVTSLWLPRALLPALTPLGLTPASKRGDTGHHQN